MLGLKLIYVSKRAIDKNASNCELPYIGANVEMVMSCILILLTFKSIKQAFLDSQIRIILTHWGRVTHSQ